MRIGFSSNAKGVFPALVRRTTKSKWSHCFYFTPPVCGVDSVIEASILVQIVPFERNYKYDPDETYEIYELTEADPEVERLTQIFMYSAYAGEMYGFLQLLYFLFKRLGLKKNPFTSGIICSEMVYLMLVRLGEPYSSLLKNLERDTVEAQDLYEVVISHPSLFKLVDSKTR